MERNQQKDLKTADVYARYSSDNQTEQSSEGQLRVCQEYATRNNIIILDRPCSYSKGDIITKIGQAGDYLITVQGDSNQDFAHSTKNSLTLSSVLQEADAENSSTDIPGYEKNLVLGDLTSLNPSYGTGL